ncbi:MAG: alpha-galactosidase [Clostridia bacterium]|nr:alpha-galactosidase [Clostridia bacterium]
MLNIQRIPDVYKILVQNGEPTDSKVEFEVKSDRVSVYLTATADKPRFVAMRWLHKFGSEVKILGDDWERLQGNKSFTSLNADRALPWYFIVREGESVTGCGVAVRPNSFVTFLCDGEGVTAYFDVRCGGTGVELGGRKLHVGDIICRNYQGLSSFKAACEYCKELCSDPILPKEPVYGGNNWYYAYGKTSHEEIIEDTKLQATLAEGLPVRPFMVLDDGWSVNSCAGPWLPNEKFPDMKGLADEIKAMGVRPGIWVRFLHSPEYYEERPDMMIKKAEGGSALDPSHPDVKALIKEDIERIKEWGFELIKHDFSSYDMFNDFAYGFYSTVANEREWSFYDKTKTSAEIVLDFYRLIKETAGDMYIIGCNTFSHLIAGLAEMNRVGDDTSGHNWDRTRAYGVNSLAFRLPQHNAFYAIDADCVGFEKNIIDWKFNGQFADLLAKSGTPLFISSPNGILSDEEIKGMKAAYARFVEQKDTIEPLDWEYNDHPRIWNVNGKVEEYEWQMDSIPEFCYKRPWQLH